MALEIERKFLLKSDAWRVEADAGTPIIQGYLVLGPPAAVRVRLQGDQAILTIKQLVSMTNRIELEYPIPLADARQMLDSMTVEPPIKKVRFHVPAPPHTWEIDVFENENAGLVVAEIELSDPDEPFEKPLWLGEEVTDDPRYLNVSLSKHPFTKWDAPES